MEQGAFAPDNGACIGYPTDWWFPLLTDRTREQIQQQRSNTAQAKSVCHGCEFRIQCLEYSLEWEPWGIWGGLDEQERAQIRYTKQIRLNREGRIVFSGIGMRDANGSVFAQGDKALRKNRKNNA